VDVDGKLLGTAAESQRAPLSLAIPAGGDSPYEGSVELRVERDGGAPVLATLRVRAGSDVTFAVPFAPALPEGTDAPSASATRGEVPGEESAP
jgi:serine/threonine-protein kinase